MSQQENKKGEPHMTQPTITLTGTYKQVMNKVTAYELEGYRVVWLNSKIDWPFFWRLRYTTVLYSNECLSRIRGTISFIRGGDGYVRLVIDDNPPTHHEQLQIELQDAIDHEEYEQAAKLRDEIKAQYGNKENP